MAWNRRYGDDHMAGEIEEWRVRQWASNVHHTAQGMQNKLRGTTREEVGAAERFGFDRLGPMKGRRPTSRLEPIIHAVAVHSRRWVFPTPYSFDAIVDSFAKQQQLHEPESEYAKSGAADYNHQIDQAIIDAALGTAMEGEQTLAGVTLPAAQVIADGSTGLLLDKIVTARAMLAHETNNEMEIYGPYYFLYDPMDIRYLFAQTKVTSADFTNVKALMSGEMVQGFLGFTWIPSNQLPLGVTAANERNSLAYARAGLGFAANAAARKERAGERNDITGHPMQISIFDQFGAVRIDDKLVIRVDIDTSAAIPAS